jgi:Helix-turn-helix domain
MSPVQPPSGAVNVTSNLGRIRPNRSARVHPLSVPADVRRGFDTISRDTIARVCAEHHTSPGVARSVLCAMADNVDWQHGDLFPLQGTLARRSGWGVRTMRRAIRALEALGLVQTLRGYAAWRTYGAKLGASADVRRVAYKLVEWARRRGLVARPVPAPRPVSEHSRRAVRERETAERARCAAIARQTAATACEQAGVDPRSLYGLPQTWKGTWSSSRDRLAASAAPRGIGRRLEDSGTSPTPTGVGKSSPSGDSTTDADSFRERAGAFLRPKEERGGVPPRGSPPR